MIQKKILIVEDDRDILALVRAYLEKEGCLVYGAENARNGMSIVKEENLDLILLDIMLPDLDGIQFCRQIRQISEIPIIFISSRSEIQDVVTGLDVGGDDYITKPFDPKILVARVKANLRRDAYQPGPRKRGEKKTHTLYEPLTKREVETLVLINEGYSNKEIARQLFLSEGTVKMYNNKIFRKLEVKNRTEAVSVARSLGLL